MPETEWHPSQSCYRGGYKYQLVEEYSVSTDVIPEEDVRTDFIDLDLTGRLVIRRGYAWDGPSGPTIDTSDFMRGSLVHDALYQLMRGGKISKARWRDAADRLLRHMCRDDGMGFIRAWVVYQGVRRFGDPSASPETRKQVKKGPKRPRT